MICSPNSHRPRCGAGVGRRGILLGRLSSEPKPAVVTNRVNTNNGVLRFTFRISFSRFAFFCLANKPIWKTIWTVAVESTGCPSRCAGLNLNLLSSAQCSFIEPVAEATNNIEHANFASSGEENAHKNLAFNLQPSVRHRCSPAWV